MIYIYMKYIITESQLNQINEYFSLQDFDPVYYLKNLFKKNKNFYQQGNAWELKEEMQKYVDLIYFAVSKTENLKFINGLNVVKVNAEGVGSRSKSEYFKEVNVVIYPKIPDWLNPDNRNYDNEFNLFKNKFEEIEKFMGFGTPISKNPRKIKFRLYKK